MNESAGQPQILPWLLGALAGTMGVLALISVMVVAAGSDRQLFLASVEPLPLAGCAMLCAFALMGSVVLVFSQARIAAGAHLCSVVGVIALSWAMNGSSYSFSNGGHRIVEQDSKLWLMAYQGSNWSAVEWTNQVPTLAHASRGLFTSGSQSITDPFDKRLHREDVPFSPGRSTTLACYYFVSAACLACWVIVLPLAMWRVISPGCAYGRFFLTACPAVWTALMVATLYLLT